MNLANQLTVLRIGMALAMFAALIQTGAVFHEAAFALFALAMITDWVDGYVARRTHTAHRNRAARAKPWRPGARRRGICVLVR